MLEEPDQTRTGGTRDIGNKAPGTPRLITPGELATVCKIQRHLRGWSQETMAEITRLQVRTIQRVEKGEPSSAETRRALARAFEAEDLDVFNKAAVFPTVEEMEAKAKAEREAFERDNIMMAVQPTNGRGLARLLADAGAILVHANDDVLETGDARRAWAGFADNARDWLDIADEIGELGRLDAAEHLDEQLRELEQFGVMVRVGTRTLVSGSGEKAFPFIALYVVGVSKTCEITDIAVPKRVRMGF